jgi:8-oxo-dGTP diphosphatase
MIMTHLHVACAIIERDGRVLATQRSSTMSMPLKWEFPGGKIHKDESAEACLKREVREELDIDVTVGQPLTAVTHEHAACSWLMPAELHTLDWAEADRPVIDEYQELVRTQTGR